MSWFGKLVDRVIPRYRNYEAALAAMRRDDRAELEGLLRGSPPLVNQAYCISGSLLHNAAMSGQVEFAEMLIARGAKVNAASTRDRETPLHFAAECGELETVRVLVKHGANVNAMSLGGSALELAAMKGHTDIVAFLSDKGADCSQLHVAAMLGDAATVERLMSKGSGPGLLARYGMAPLHWAALGGNRACAAARQLIAHGADVNALDEWNRTPLCCASESGACEMADALIDGGALVDPDSPGAETPLRSALSHDHPAVAVLLIQRGAAVNTGDARGPAPLKLACVRGFTEVARLLIDRGADLTPRGDFSPLHYAAHNGRLEITGLLIEHGADVNAEDSEGSTPLREAMAEGHGDVADLLRQHGARD